MTLSGTTVGAPNNVSSYSPGLGTFQYAGGEVVYQFTLAGPSTVSLAQNTSNAVDGADLDHILLSSTSADTVVGFVDESDSFGGFAAGTYFLSVDTFSGDTAGNFPPSAEGPFNFDLTASAIVGPAATPTNIGGSLTSSLAAGEVQFYQFTAPNGAFTIDTEGSTLFTATGTASNDTELGVYDSLGNLVALDDDDGTGLLSLLTFGPGAADGELVAGDTYFLAAGAFNTTFGANFGATSTSTRTGTLNINGLTVVPEPASLATLGMAGLGLLARRRRVA